MTMHLPLAERHGYECTHDRLIDSVEAQHATQHIMGDLGDDFYRPDDQTNSVKALQETS